MTELPDDESLTDADACAVDDGGVFSRPLPMCAYSGAQTCVSAHFTNKQETPQHRTPQ